VLRVILSVSARQSTGKSFSPHYIPFFREPFEFEDPRSANGANAWQYSNCFHCAVKEKTCLLMCSKQVSNVQCRPRHRFLRSLARRYPMFELSIVLAPLSVLSVHLVPRNRAARQHTSRTGRDHPLRVWSSGRRYRRRYGVNGRV
jgi:hypothetical protein